MKDKRKVPTRAYEAMKKYSMRKTQITSVPLVEGETIEQMVRRLKNNEEPIDASAPEIFTERSEGVISQFNIRADRWELAAEAMDSLTKSKIAAREKKGKVIPLNEDGKAESIQGGDTKEG